MKVSSGELSTMVFRAAILMACRPLDGAVGYAGIARQAETCETVRGVESSKYFRECRPVFFNPPNTARISFIVVLGRNV
jgi:hypothetical protein